MTTAPVFPQHPLFAIYSDIDGTLAHYEKPLLQQGYTRVDPSEYASLLLQQQIQEQPQVEVSPSSVSLFQESIERLGQRLPLVWWRWSPNNHNNRSDAYARVDAAEPTRLVRYVATVPVPNLTQTLGAAFVSLRTLLLVDELREAHGVALVLMTGARTSTLLNRRRSGALPVAAFDVGEGGGKIWHRTAPPATTTTTTTNFQQDERNIPTNENSEDPYEVACMDAEWGQLFEPITGPMGQLDADPLCRSGGALWDCFRDLHALGFALDAKSFSTSFLVDVAKSRDVVSGGRTVAEAERFLKDRFRALYEAKGLTYVTNLSKGQVCSRGCSKRTAMFYTLAKLLLLRQPQPTTNAAASVGEGSETLLESSSLITDDVLKELMDSIRGAIAEDGGCASTSTESTTLKDQQQQDEQLRHKDRNDVDVEVPIPVALQELTARRCVALFDDENDLSFAVACGIGFLPSVAHTSVLETLARLERSQQQKKINDDSSSSGLSSSSSSSRWYRTPVEGFLGTEYALHCILEHQRKFSK